MIEQLDQKLRERVNKPIGNIRLIASRSKRANVLDATQRAETVVNLLNDFRQYLTINQWGTLPILEFATFGHDTDTYIRITQAIAEAGNIYHELSHSKQVSYKEEYKQVFLLLGDLRDYLIKAVGGRVSNA